MKYSKIAISLLFCIFAVLGFSQSRLSLNSGQFTKITQSIPTRSVEYVDDGVIVTYSIPTADEISTAGSNEIIWGIQGFTNNTGEGNPAVPMRNDIFSFEGSANVSVELIEENHRDYMVNIAPFTDSEQKEGSGVMKPYEGFFPEEPIFLRGKEEYRGNDISYVAICPVQYDYENSIARAYTKLVYKISYAESPMKAQRRTPGGESGAPGQFSGVNTFANVAIPLVKSEEENSMLKANGSGDILALQEGYLIITPNAYKAAAEKFARWKRILGYKVTVISKVLWSETSIKNAISSFYSSNMNPTYVLFLGNATQIPCPTFEQTVDFVTDNYVTDYYYMCMGGDDDTLADLIRGRIPANTLDEAYTAIDKIIRYEMGLEVNDGNYNKGVHLSYFEENPYSKVKGVEYEHFIRTSEEIRNHLMDYENKVIDRLYVKKDSVTPMYYCESVNSIHRGGTSLQLLPEELRSPNFAWHSQTGTTNSIVNLWSQHPLYVLYISHSVNDRWSFPYFEANKISRLNNITNPPFLFSMSCQAGRFDKDVCLAKEFICQKGAAVNVVASTSPGWCGYQDALTEAMFNFIFPSHYWEHTFEINTVPNSDNTDIIPITNRYVSVATALDEGLNYGMSWLTNNGGTLYPYQEQDIFDTRRSFENFGDPTLYMPMAKPLPYAFVSVQRNASNISVSFSDTSNSTITFYNPTTGENYKYYKSSFTSFPTTNSQDWIVCVNAYGRIPFVSYGNNVTIDVTPIH